jgi:hypothetical protein
VAYSFDGANRIITLTAQTAASVRDIYARWADWVAAGNAQWLPAFSTVGGETIDAASGTSVPIYAFLLNGWRIRPQESSHTLTVSDGVLLVDGGGDPFLNTLGNFVVRINYQQPVQAITVATGGGGGASAAQVADAVWQRAIEAGLTAEQIMRIMLAALAGQSTGVGGPAETYKGQGNENRVVTTFDASGNRLTVALNGS